MTIHKLIQNPSPRYLCNQAVHPLPRKASFYWKEVTCKNCLKQKIRRKNERRSKMLKFTPIKNKFKGEVIIGNDTHYEVKNSCDELIGRIYYSRVGKFMHWCFFPDECDGRDLFFTNGCLKEISNFITKLYGRKK